MACVFRCSCARPGFTRDGIFCAWKRPKRCPRRVAELPGRELTVIEYLNARGADGKVRKYRVMMIDGQLYPLHVAISSHWKIHYFTADMANSAEHRAEDAEFLENMPAVLGPRAMEALAADSIHPRPRLRRHRFRLERDRRTVALRSQRHHGGESARARRKVGLPASRGRANFRRRAQNAAGEGGKMRGGASAVARAVVRNATYFCLHETPA